MKAKLTAAVLGLGMLGVAAVAIAHDSKFHASLDGYQAVPALSLPHSSARATIRVNSNSSIDYQVKYDVNTAATVAGVPVGAVTQIHVHFGRPGVTGGVIAFLCSNLGNGPVGTPLCPATPATVSGTLTAASIVGPNGQGIAPTEIVEAIVAIRAEATYACVHTIGLPGGSIRGAVEDED